MKPSEANSPVATATLGERIKAIRQSWRWSQEEMAHALHVDQASISFWERDRIKPSGSALMALGSLFRTSAKALEGGQGFRIPQPPSGLETGKADRTIPKSISLPMGGTERPIVVDLGDGSTRDLQLSEALMALAHGVKGGRRTWLVME